MSDQPRRPVFFWLLLLTCVVYAGLFAFTVYAVVRYYGVEKAPGWRASTDGRSWFVSDVDDAGPAAGRVQVGDRLLAINGDDRRTVFGLFEWSFVDGGKPYRLDLERRGERVSLELPMPLVPGQRLTPIFALVGLAFFICGGALALLRPQDGQVRLAGAFLMSAGFATLHQTLQPIFGFLVGWEQIAQLGVVPLSLWAFPLAYHFFSRFPVGRSPGPLWRFIQWLLYAVFVLVIWPAWFYIYLARSLFGNGTRFLFAHAWLFPAACYVINSGIFVYMVICFVLAIVLAARNYHHLRDRDSRRRIRLVVAGVMIALIPFVGLTFAFNVADWIRPQTYWLYYPLSFLAMLCIPGSIGAAVWKEQLFDIRVLVRRGLQYLFAESASARTRETGRRCPARCARAARGSGRQPAKGMPEVQRLLRQHGGPVRKRRRRADADAAGGADARRQIPVGKSAGTRRLWCRVRSVRPEAAAPGGSEGDDGVVVWRCDRASSIRARGAGRREDRPPPHHPGARLRRHRFGRGLFDHGTRCRPDVAGGDQALRRDCSRASCGMVPATARRPPVRS